MIETFSYRFINTAGSTLVKSGSGVLHSVVLGETAAQAIKVYDSIGSGGTQIAELKASIVERTYEFHSRFAKGLYIENPGGSKLTIIYR